MVSPFTEKNPPKNGSYRDIVLTGFLEDHDRRIKEMNMFEMEKQSFLTLLPLFANMMPVPYVPSMIDVGGLHVKTPKKLPMDLQQLLDNAKEGVIYFSLGSNLKSALLPNEKRQILLNTFSKLKETVLWKWEDDTLPGKPANVHIAKWLPQQDVLAHPNLKLFITHGGLLSTTETIYHGVPALAIPIAGDQKLNARQMVNMGIGLTIGYQEITEEALSNKINQLLSNPNFLKNAKSRSDFYHDRLVSPLDTAIYWVEFALVSIFSSRCHCIDIGGDLICFVCLVLYY
ncbi:hypothetical protein MTP99_017086 [Tenebrio molitor]|nr:hypothetical protein MTP99_017086 [Tenebrio molitor]